MGGRRRKRGGEHLCTIHLVLVVDVPGLVVDASLLTFWAFVGKHPVDLILGVQQCSLPTA
jgi:hypothetical protein